MSVKLEPLKVSKIMYYINRGKNMDGNLRREELIKILKQNSNAISASRLAKIFNVSRQIIVGDIALLRAQGETIVASSKGYTLNPYSEGMPFIVAVNHKEADTLKELLLFVKMGTIVVNVMVEHPLYGELVGNLNIKTNQDIEEFLNIKGSLLSSLTNGIHLHTIICKDLDHYNDVVSELEKENLLYNN